MDDPLCEEPLNERLGVDELLRTDDPAEELREGVPKERLGVSLRVERSGVKVLRGEAT